MDSSRLAIADASTALRRAEWECFANEVRVKANALIEAMIDDADEAETRKSLIDLAMLNPVDHQFEVDTELFYGDEPRPDETEGTRDDAALRSLDDDLDSSRG